MSLGSLADIYARIRKLQAISVERGNTPEEAANAAARIQEMLFKYNLDIESIPGDEGNKARSEYTKERFTTIGADRTSSRDSDSKKGEGSATGFNVAWRRSL